MLSGYIRNIISPLFKQLKCALLLHSRQAIILSFGPFLFWRWQTEQTPPWSRPLRDDLDSGLDSESLDLAICFSMVDLLRDPAGRPLFFGMLLSEGSKTFFAF